MVAPNHNEAPGTLRVPTGDLKRLHADDRRLALPAYAIVELIVDREIVGDELLLLASYGDLSDCRKVYFGATGTTISHRLVYREVADGRLEIVEIVAVEQREVGYAYLLAAARLGRLPAETKKRFNRLHQTVIKRRSTVAGRVEAPARVWRAAFCSRTPPPSS